MLTLSERTERTLDRMGIKFTTAMVPTGAYRRWEVQFRVRGMWIDHDRLRIALASVLRADRRAKRMVRIGIGWNVAGSWMDADIYMNEIEFNERNRWAEQDDMTEDVRSMLGMHGRGDVAFR